MPEDYQVHIYHSKKDRLWVKQWLTGMLEANRYNVTTNRRKAPTNTSRMILVLTPELFDEPFCFEILDAIEGKTVLSIKLRDCDVPEEISNESTSYMDLTTTDLSNLTFHITFMFRIRKPLNCLCLFAQHKIALVVGTSIRLNNLQQTVFLTG